MSIAAKLHFQTDSLVPAGRIALYLGALAMGVWFGLQIFKPAPQVAPLMQTAPSAQFRMDQSAEARLLGVETQGGLTPPAIQLLGTFASENKQGGAAVMAIDGKPEESLRLGDPVANGWELAEVGPTYVIITRSGQRHRVELPVLRDEGGLSKVN